MSISEFVAVVNNLLRGVTEMVRILNLLLLWMKKSEFILVYVYLNSTTFFLFLKLLLTIISQKIYS